MSKSAKSPDQQLQALNNLIAEEIRFLGPRHQKLKETYSKGLGLLAPFDQQFVNQFGDKFAFCSQELEVSMQNLLFSNNSNQKSKDQDGLVDLKKQAEDSISARRAAKILFEDMNDFCSKHRAVEKGLSSEAMFRDIEMYRSQISRLEEKTSDFVFPAALNARIDEVRASLGAVLGLPQSSLDIDALDVSLREDVQRVLFGLKEASEEFWKVLSAVHNFIDSVDKSKIGELQKEIEELVIERVRSCEGEENEDASFYMNLGYRAKNADEALYSERDYDWEEPDNNVVIEELLEIRSRLEKE